MSKKDKLAVYLTPKRRLSWSAAATRMAAEV